MRVKVLSCSYSDGSSYEIIRVYLEKDYELAEKDYEMMCNFASDCRNWKLSDVDVFGLNNQ